jgi:hypothetical protein
MKREKNLTKDNKRKESKIKVLAHKLLASTLSYLILSPMSGLVILCLSSHYRFILLPHYELVPLQAFVGYVQTISVMLHELLLNWCHP